MKWKPCVWKQVLQPYRTHSHKKNKEQTKPPFLEEEMPGCECTQPATAKDMAYGAPWPKDLSWMPCFSQGNPAYQPPFNIWRGAITKKGTEPFAGSVVTEQGEMQCRGYDLEPRELQSLDLEVWRPVMPCCSSWILLHMKHITECWVSKRHFCTSRW